MVGYASLKTFWRAFQKETGLMPAGIGTACYDSVRQGATSMLRQLMCPPSLTERPMPPFR